MSHFTVAVFTEEGGKSLEQLLAPYQENNMGDCPKEYLQFNDVTDEYMEDYNNGSVEMIKCPDGSLVYSWDDKFKKPGEFGFGSNTHEVPENQGYERVNVPHKERFETFDQFITSWAGYEKDPETGKYGYWENPNRKWDWYQVGGSRWNGLLLIKNESNGQTGELGAFGHKKENSNPAPIGYKWVDSARIKDIDWSKMQELNCKQAEKNWEEALKEDGPMRYFGYGVHKNDTKESYIQRQTEFSTYAVVTPDGIWHSKGEMGWWGCSSETEEEAKQWGKSFMERFIVHANPELTLIIVDCHT